MSPNCPLDLLLRTRKQTQEDRFLMATSSNPPLLASRTIRLWSLWVWTSQ